MSVRVTRQYFDVLAAGVGDTRVSRQYVDTLVAGLGAARISKQYVDVLLRGDGKLRVTKQYIDMLGNVPIDRTLEDTLEFVDIFNTGFPRAVTDTLVFNDTYPRHMDAGITDTIVFSELYPRNYFGTLEDLYVFAEQPIEYEVSPGHVDTLEFEEEFDWETNNVFARTLKTKVSMSSVFTGRNSVFHLNQHHWIDFSALHDGRNAVSRGGSIDTVVFLATYKPGMTATGAFTDTMVYTDSHTNLYTLANTLTFNQTFLRGKGKNLVDTLTYSDIHDRLWWSKKTTTDLTNFNQAFAYFEEGKCIEKNYNLFVGASDSDNPTPPPTNLPLPQTLPTGVRFQLFYPATGVAVVTVTLPAPEFGNKDQVVYNRINRETRGGDLEIFVDPIWPQLNNLLCTFTGVSDSEIVDFKSFIATYLGKEIRIMDWEGRTWIGVIKTPLDAIVTEHNNNSTISFEFVGQMLDVETPGNIFGVSDLMGFKLESNRGLNDPFLLVDYYTYIILNP